MQIEGCVGKDYGKNDSEITLIKLRLLILPYLFHTMVAPLKNELFYQKAKIIERVNEALGRKGD